MAFELKGLKRMVEVEKMTQEACARHFDVSTACIYKRCKKLGLKTPVRRAKLKGLRKMVVNKKMTHRECAEYFGVSRACIQVRCRDLGLTNSNYARGS